MTPSAIRSGDALLKSVAKRLHKAVRQTDVLARLGGDEFAIIRMGGATLEQSEQVAKRLLRAITTEHSVLGHKINITAQHGDRARAYARQHVR